MSMSRAARRRFLSRLLAAAALPLAACTPEYNWREIDVADGRARAAFPARVQTEQRPVPLDGRQLTFSLTTAAVGDALFAVGYVLLPEDARGDAQAERRLADALARTLYANLGSRPPEQLPEPGREIELRAGLGGEPALLLARVLVHGGAVIEAVAMGPERALPAERAREFVRSLQPAR